MSKNYTIMPMDSEEGTVLTLRHGSKFTLRDDNSPTGFTQVVKGGKIRVTTAYAEHLIANHGRYVDQLGFISCFVEDGKEEVATDESVAAAQEAAQAALREAEEAKADALEKDAEIAELKAQLEAAKAADKPEATEEQQEEQQEEPEEGSPDDGTKKARGTRSRK